MLVNVNVTPLRSHVILVRRNVTAVRMFVMLERVGVLVL